MGFALTVSCAILLAVANAKCENQSEVIKKIAFELSSYMRTDCIFVFSGFESTSEAYFEVFKALSSEARRFVGAYSFEKRQFKKFCAKPMNILIGEEFKDEFARFTNRDSMTDEAWVIFLTSSVYDFLNETRPPFDAEVVLAEMQSLLEIRMWEVYAVDVGFPLRITPFGMWTEKGGMTYPELPLYDRRSDLEGKTMRIGSNENWPICTFNNGKWDGYMPMIWMELEHQLNCTTLPVRSVDNATGLQLEDGSWNGLMGMLIKGDIDIIAAELTLTKDRVDYIEFGYPAISARYQIYFKALGNRLQWQAIFQPLSLWIWLALFAWMIIGSVCISMSYNYCMKYGFKEDLTINFTRTESFFFMLQSLCQQGYPVVPKSLSCRILFVTAYALSTIMIPSYSASLISSLTKESPIRPFNSLTEMTKDGRYTLLVKNNSAAFTHFSKATNPLYREAYRKLVDKPQENVPFEETSRVFDEFICKKKNYALYGVNLVINFKMEHNQPPCYVLTLTNPLSRVFVGLGLRMDSPFSRIIDYKLQKLKTIGAISRIEYKLRPLRGDSSNDIGFRQVEFDEIFQVFLLLLIGMVAAVVILAVELIVWNTKDSAKRMIQFANQQSDEKGKPYMICFDVFMD